MPKLPFQARQGDVFIEEIEGMDPTERITGAQKVPADHGRYVLAYGEVTGHAHAIEATPDVELYEAPDGTLYLRVLGEPETTKEVRHEEHAPIALPTNKVYRVVRQREATDTDERLVAD